MATTAPLGWKSAQCPCSWGRDKAVNHLPIIHKPSISRLLTSSVRLHCRLWSTEFQRQTRRSWAHVRNMSLNGWEAKPHSSSVWPWTHHKKTVSAQSRHHLETKYLTRRRRHYNITNSPGPPPGSRHWTFPSEWNYERFRPGIHPPSPLIQLWWSHTDLGPVGTHTSHMKPKGCDSRIKQQQCDQPRCHGQLVVRGPTGWFFCLSLRQSAHFRSSSHTCRTHFPHDLWSGDWSEMLDTQVYRWITRVLMYFIPKHYYCVDKLSPYFVSTTAGRRRVLPRGLLPVGVSAEFRVHTSRTPPESPVRMSPVLRKTRHWTNFGFSYFYTTRNTNTTRNRVRKLLGVLEPVTCSNEVSAKFSVGILTDPIIIGYYI